MKLRLLRKYDIHAIQYRIDLPQIMAVCRSMDKYEGQFRGLETKECYMLLTSDEA